MGILRTVAQSTRRNAADLKSFAGDTTRTVLRKGTSPLSVGAVGLGGAYTYSQYAGLQEQEANTEAHDRLQDRLEELQQAYINGEISREEYEQLREEAIQAYNQAVDDEFEPPPSGTLDFFSQLGFFQYAAIAVVAIIGLIFVGRPIAQALADGNNPFTNN